MKKIVITITFIATSIIFNVAKNFLPPNFYGIEFYSLLFLFDILCLHLISSLASINKNAKLLLIIYFLPFALLVLVASLGIFYPLPDWNTYFKIIINTLLFSSLFAHIIFNITVLIAWIANNWRNKLKIPPKHYKHLPKNSKRKNKTHYFEFKTHTSQFLLKLGAAISCCILITCFTAIFTWTKNINLTEIKINCEKIPNGFDTYKIVQLSDIHSDYQYNDKLMGKAVEIINKQNADIILITGDFISYKSSELNPLINRLKELNSKDGIYLVLGNHDYGTYYHWKNDSHKNKNFNDLLNYFKGLNWTLLRNESIYLVKDNDTLILVGTEHYSRSKSHYPSNANIELALENIPNSIPIIAMTHNPDYWADKIRFMDNPILLTFSGHTHGMQIGFTGKSKKTNLYCLKNRYSAGLYEYNNKYLYINTGFGTVGFPFRIGIKPEISVVTISKSTSSLSN